MKRRDPQQEPQSETPEKKAITKTHEEFIDNNQPSMTKQEYEKKKQRERIGGDREEKEGRS